ncbi:hypothetical protein ABTL69_19630, partial [Acinetobacter baumannii]
MQSRVLSDPEFDPDEGVYFGLVGAGECDVPDDEGAVRLRLGGVFEPTRALARSVAVGRFRDHLRSASW